VFSELGAFFTDLGEDGDYTKLLLLGAPVSPKLLAR